MVEEILAAVPERKLRALVRGERDSIRVPESKDSPTSTPIAETELNEEYTLVGVVREIDDINTFTREDGTEGQVRNIRVQDRTGSIRVALWGEKAEIGLDVGDYVHLFDAEVDTGYQDQKEASVGFDSTVRVIPHEKDDRHVTITTKEET